MPAFSLFEQIQEQHISITEGIHFFVYPLQWHFFGGRGDMHDPSAQKIRAILRETGEQQQSSLNRRLSDYQ
jgi:hypothetical protein